MANGASSRVKMCSWSKDVFVELMGEADAKTPVLYVGNCLSRFLAKEEQRREWIVKICRKNTPTFTKKTCVCGAQFDGGKRQNTFPFLQDLCGLSLREKRAVELGQLGCKIPGRSRDGG